MEQRTFSIFMTVGWHVLWEDIVWVEISKFGQTAYGKTIFTLAESTISAFRSVLI